jgi:predicted P-loop ATPase
MNQNWKSELLTTKAGEIRRQLSNAMHAFRDAPPWSGVLAHDEFAMKTMCMAPPPWRNGETQWPREWTSYDDLLAANWLQHEGIGVTPAITQQAVEAVARDQSFHPVRDFLDGLTADGVPRLATWLTDYMGVTDTPYHREVGRIILVSAVARIYRPGCKVDTVPIFEGRQGAKKSTAMRVMFDPWFTDDLAELGSKDAALQTRGVWGIEIGELDAMSRSEVSKVKAFVSRTTDRYRPPYGSRVIEVPRGCSFWGTTNQDHYLKDETGNRRYLPVTVGEIDIAGLTDDRDLLWAEAVTAFKAGEDWWITDKEILAEAANQQRDRYAGDAWDGKISSFIASRNQVTVAEVLRDCLYLEVSRWGQTEQNRIARSLRSMGWERKQRRSSDGRDWVYRRVVTDDAPFGERTDIVTTLRLVTGE